MAKLKTTPNLPFNLKFETAASLLDILTASSVHAQREADAGHPALLKQFETIEPLFHHIRVYVEQNS